MALSAAIFLDKDGTLLVDVPYNVEPARMRFAPRAAEGLAVLAQLGRPLIVVSNQPGIALGKFGYDDLYRMVGHLRLMFAEAGAELTAFLFCPHEAPLQSSVEACTCRKPAPGLLLEAAQRHAIDLSQSWMIGDILNDVEAGRRAGCTTVLINNGNETEWVPGPLRTPHYVVRDFLEAARCIMAFETSREACE